MTEKESIIQEFCKSELICLKIIIIRNGNKRIDGDFLEKYLELVLKFKSVIAGSDYYAKTNLFHDIEYITFINMGHGVSFFKHFLYKDYLSYKHYDKILIPAGEIFINIAKKYGWKEENIIKIGYPKWDSYNLNKGIIQQNGEKKGKSIFLMFTWRDIRPGKQISKYYFRNILKILNSKKLNMILFYYRIILYFTFHHVINWAKIRIMPNRRKILRYVRPDNISEVLSKTYLIVSDFSSVIFEIIYRKKPFIIYVPDAKDPNIINLYNQGYYDIINGLKNGSTYFENKFFEVDAVIDKIIYYIINNFRLEGNLMKFYDDLGLNGTNNTMTFVEYLKKLK
jgi:CDP-glycerol glycerophosphotransferase (TagB/SpsB family)